MPPPGIPARTSALRTAGKMVSTPRSSPTASAGQKPLAKKSSPAAASSAAKKPLARAAAAATPSVRGTKSKSNAASPSKPAAKAARTTGARASRLGAAGKNMTSSSQTKRTTPAGRRAGASRTGALKPGAKRKTTAEVRAADLKKKKEKEEKEKEKKKEEEEKEKEKKEEEEREKERARKHQEHMRQVNERLAAEQAARKAKELAATAELLPDANGIRTISLVRLEKALEVVAEDQRTPIVVDPSGKAATFLSYQNETLIDCKGIFLKVSVHKTMKLEDMKEELRKKLVSALKYGHTLHLNFGNSAADLSPYDSPDFFPLSKKEEDCAEFLREKDKDKNGFFFPKEGFNVVVSSAFQPEDFEEFLKDALPFNQLGPVVIKPEEKKR